jgi:hypothetical protein
LPVLLIALILLPILSGFFCAIRWGGNGILGSCAAWLILAFALNLISALFTGETPMFAHAPAYAKIAFFAVSFSFQGILCCVTGALGGWAGLAVRRRKTKTISAKTAEVFE